MRRRCLAALCVFLVVTGCGAVRRVDPTADPSGLAAINARTAYGQVEVELATGERVDVSRLRIEGGTATWHQRGRLREVVTVPVSDIRAIRVPATGGGTGRTIAGAVMGFVGGALIGAATAPLASPEDSFEDFLVDYSLLSARVVLPALLGGVIGGFVGASMNPRDVFRLVGSTDSEGSVRDAADAAPVD